MHFAMLVDTNKELVVGARTGDELSKDEHGLLSQLFQSLSVVGLPSICRLICPNEHLFYAVLRHHNGH